MLFSFIQIIECFFMFSYVTGGNTFPKPLTDEEEERYLQELQNGSEEAKNILIERNLRLVAHIVKKYSNYSKDSDDLISIGSIGLIKAIVTFKPGKCTKLVTYAARCIDNEILMYIRSSKKYSKNVSLQDSLGTDKDGSEIILQDKVADDKMSVDEEVELKLQINQLYENVEKVLKGREKTIIKMRYGLFDGKEFTQRDIAKKLGISRSYVSRIEKKALEKLLKEMKN